MDYARPEDLVKRNIHQMSQVGDVNTCVVPLLDSMLSLRATDSISSENKSKDNVGAKNPDVESGTGIGVMRVSAFLSNRRTQGGAVVLEMTRSHR
jgi:hypothetical protein